MSLRFRDAGAKVSVREITPHNGVLSNDYLLRTN